MGAKVIVVGSANMDMVAFAPKLPAPGETVLGTRFEMACGGKGANQAVACARLGAETWFIGRVGTDAICCFKVFRKQVSTQISSGATQKLHLVSPSSSLMKRVKTK